MSEMNNSNISPYTPIQIGSYADGYTCEYSLHKTSNFHINVLGRTGSGKTHILKKLIRAYWARGITVFSIDTQGDLEDSISPPHAVNTIEFTYNDALGSINPLIINNYDGSGGLLIAVKQVIECVRIFYPELGSRNIEDLTQLLLEFYEYHGITQSSRQSWSHTAPIWSDFETFIENNIKLLKANAGDGGRQDTNATSQKDDVPLSMLDPDANKKVKVTKTGLRKLEDIHRRVKRLGSIGLFGVDSLAQCICPGKINRFSIVKLHPTDQQVMIRLLLDRIFARAVRGCAELNPPLPDFMVVLDEGKHAVFTARSSMSSLNRIATEGRKYGLGMIMGVQGLVQLTEELVSAPAITIVAPIHVTQYTKAVSQLNLKKAWLRDLKPRSQALTQIDCGDFKVVNI